MDERFANCFKSFDGQASVAVLTGAGVSTLSGIPDFRGKDGMYRSLWNGLSRETLLELDFFHRRPDLFYRFAAEELYPMLDKVPSIAHIALAQLQKAGRCGKIYTQNIDGLHEKAGAESRELHGSLAKHSCLECGRKFPPDTVRAEAEAGEVPRCPCGGLIKPEVVFYGENLDEELLTGAFDCFAKADIALVLGSSLTVSPVSSLPAMTARHGGEIVIVNAQTTQYDSKSAFRFDDIAEFCSAMQEYFR